MDSRSRHEKHLAVDKKVQEKPMLTHMIVYVIRPMYRLNRSRPSLINRQIHK
jgi:hypothetical protein